MPDPYWDEIAKRTREMNQRGQDSERESREESWNRLTKCVTCGEEFLPQGKRVRCDDCVGERGARSTQSACERFSDGDKMRRSSEDADELKRR